MNQILFLKTYRKQKYLYLVIFIFLVLFGLSFFAYNTYVRFKNRNILQHVKANYELTRLYNNNSSTNPVHISFNSEIAIDIIGKITINKINVDYPIFSILTDDLLKISICKFYGPELNERGNLCLCRA